MKFGSPLSAALLCVLTPGLANAAALGGGQSLDINLIRVSLTLAFCLVLAVAAILVFRRKGGAAPWFGLTRSADTRAISVKETRRISLHAEICRFECDGREFLVVVTPQSATLLRERQIAQPAPS